jgi:hypothetical protein
VPDFSGLLVFQGRFVNSCTVSVLVPVLVSVLVPVLVPVLVYLCARFQWSPSLPGPIRQFMQGFRFGSRFGLLVRPISVVVGKKSRAKVDYDMFSFIFCLLHTSHPS